MYCKTCDLSIHILNGNEYSKVAKKNFQLLSVFFLFSIGLLVSSRLLAHEINYALEKVPARHVVWFYLQMGFLHIIGQSKGHLLNKGLFKDYFTFFPFLKSFSPRYCPLLI